MKQIVQLSMLVFCTALWSCNNGDSHADATGTFETDETIVSSELPGKLLQFNVQEGMRIPKDSIVGIVDSKNITLQQDQVQASIQALNEKTFDVSPQVKLLQNQMSVQQSQLSNLLYEKKRIENF